MKSLKKQKIENSIVESLHYQFSSARQGTAKRKTRAEISGGGRKPWRQKGTGRARQGSIRAVHWRGGGQAFGSSRRLYSVKLNKKVRKTALELLLKKFEADGTIKIEDMSHFEVTSTKDFLEFLLKKNTVGKVMFLNSEDTEKNALKSARNLPNVMCVNFTAINYKSLLSSDFILVSEKDRNKIEVLLNKEKAA